MSLIYQVTKNFYPTDADMNDSFLERTENPKMPYVFVADDKFSLSRRYMKPFSQRMLLMTKGFLTTACQELEGQVKMHLGSCRVQTSLEEKISLTFPDFLTKIHVVFPDIYQNFEHFSLT